MCILHFLILFIIYLLLLFIIKIIHKFYFPQGVKVSFTSLSLKKLSCLLAFLTEMTSGKPTNLLFYRSKKIAASTLQNHSLWRSSRFASKKVVYSPKIVAFTMETTSAKKLVARFNCWAVLPRKKYLKISNGITDFFPNAFSMERHLLDAKKVQKVGVFLMERCLQYSLKLGLPSQKFSLLWNL